MTSKGLTATSASKTGTNDDNVIMGTGQSEAERLEAQHKVFYDANPQLVYAPIDLSKGGYKILDQATGSGIWIRDLRDAVGADNTWVGTDIENYFPPNPPADTTYHHQSMTQPWPKDWEGTFDLVHSRFALPGIGTNSLADVVKNLIALLKPGGWIQLTEIEWDDWNNGPEGAIFSQLMKDVLAMVSNGQGVDMRAKLFPIFEEAGLTNIDYTVFSTPFGALASENIRETSEFSLFATASALTVTTQKLPPISVPREQLDGLAQRLLEEVRKDGWKSNTFALYAQKPASS